MPANDHLSHAYHTEQYSQAENVVPVSKLKVCSTPSTGYRDNPMSKEDWACSYTNEMRMWVLKNGELAVMMQDPIGSGVHVSSGGRPRACLNWWPPQLLSSY